MANIKIKSAMFINIKPWIFCKFIYKNCKDTRDDNRINKQFVFGSIRTHEKAIK